MKHAATAGADAWKNIEDILKLPWQWQSAQSAPDLRSSTDNLLFWSNFKIKPIFRLQEIEPDLCTNKISKLEWSKNTILPFQKGRKYRSPSTNHKCSSKLLA